MQFIAKLVLIAAVLGVGYYIFQRPEIQELFKPSTKEGDPLAFLDDLPEIEPKPRPERPPPRRKPRAPAIGTSDEPAMEPQTEPSEPPPEYLNQVPNDQLRKVLMQILAAKKLAQGITLSVTDSVISVTGEVDSAEKREQILDILDRGREARGIEGQDLRVR